ncbi:helix-hairpin-helix domain-containing protein [Candidatus Amesbacteria bacterium]|nr:helix-hairpin-helix domain-containing protein [Candidatus Amesbacteria bacterium]
MIKREIVLALVGLALIGGGVFWWRSGGVEQDKIEIIENNEKKAGNIKVDVGGAVAKPGVYGVEMGARIGEVLGLAGGLSEDADTKWVEMYLNRAEVVKDGEKIYIPSVNQKSKVESQNYNSKVESLININSASQAELEELPGVGPVTAKKIIDARPYGRREELVEKKIVGQKVWEQIKESVSVW